MESKTGSCFGQWHGHRTYGTVRDDPDSPCPSLVDEIYIAVSRARSLTILKDYHCAARSFLDSIADLPGGYLRDRGVYLARAALAAAGSYEVEHAAARGLEALAIGVETGSARIFTELTHLNEVLIRWNIVPAVADFRTAMKDTILLKA